MRTRVGTGRARAMLAECGGPYCASTDLSYAPAQRAVHVLFSAL